MKAKLLPKKEDIMYVNVALQIQPVLNTDYLMNSNQFNVHGLNFSRCLTFYAKKINDCLMKQM